MVVDHCVRIQAEGNTEKTAARLWTLVDGAANLMIDRICAILLRLSEPIRQQAFNPIKRVFSKLKALNEGPPNTILVDRKML
jgi:hypothetical protein